MKGTDCEKELRSNWESGTDYLNQETDLGERRGERGRGVYCKSVQLWGTLGCQVRADNLIGRKRNLDWELR